jgi:hypothetical protein
LQFHGSRLTLKLHLILNDKGVILVVDSLVKLGGNGMVSSLVLDDETLVALNTLQDGGLLDGPVTDVCPFLIVGLDVLLGVRGLPPGLPVVCELFKERCLECGGLCTSSEQASSRALEYKTYCECGLRDGRGRCLSGGLLGTHDGGGERSGSSN